jgi:hypothetical protein
MRNLVATAVVALFIFGALVGGDEVAATAVTTTWCNGDHVGGNTCVLAEYRYTVGMVSQTNFTVDHPGGGTAVGTFQGASPQWGGDITNMEGSQSVIVTSITGMYHSCGGAPPYTNASWTWAGSNLWNAGI